jgi:hypothetical protein
MTGCGGGAAIASKQAIVEKTKIKYFFIVKKEVIN